MDITTKRDDAESIIGKDLANELEEKSISSDILVVRSDESGSEPEPSTSDIIGCYDENTGGWNQDCVKQVMDKYMPDIRKELGVPVKSETVDKSLLDVVVANIYKSYGIENSVVEDAMNEPKVEKAVAGIPEKPFSHTQFGVTVTGDGANTVASPVPVKAEVEDSPEDKKEDAKEAQEMSDVDKSIVQLREAMKSGEVSKVNEAFAALGTSVEKSFVPAQKPVDMNDLAATFKSLLDEALTPLRVEIATLKAGQVNRADVASQNGIVKSKALSLNPGGFSVEDVVKRAGQPQAPTRKLSQIEMLARKSTGASIE